MIAGCGLNPKTESRAPSMAAEVQSPAEDALRGEGNPRKRRRKSKPGRDGAFPNSRSRRRSDPGERERKAKKVSSRMRKVFEKRARDYDSDGDEEGGDRGTGDGEEYEGASSSGDEGGDAAARLGEECDGAGSSGEEEGDGGDGTRSEVTSFVEGCRAFRKAFLKIMKYHLPVDALGPILSVHKNLIAEKLDEEEEEHKVKGEAKKEKHMAGENGHVKPSNFLDTKEKHLISIATKGVVKLFNAVNKAQNPQKGLNPSKAKDAKVLAKRRKETFFSELKKPTTKASGNPSDFFPSMVWFFFSRRCSRLVVGVDGNVSIYKINEGFEGFEKEGNPQLEEP